MYCQDNIINEIVKQSETWKIINVIILIKLLKKQYISFLY